MIRIFFIALPPLQRDALNTLRTLLLQNGTGHPSLGIELEIEEGSTGVLEARLRPGVEGCLRIVARLHEQPVPVAAEDRREAGRRYILTDVAIEDGDRQRDPGCRCRILR